MSVQGKTALVTGLDQRHRPQDSMLAAAAGARVILNGFGDVGRRNVDRAAGRRAGISRRRSRRCGPDSGHDAVCRTRVRRRDILVNNAGIQHVAPLDQFRWRNGTPFSPSTCRRVPYLPIGAAGMRERNWGASSTWRRCTGWRRKTSRLCGGKRRGGADQDAGAGDRAHPVTCNAICPGWVLTPLVQQQIDKRIAAGTDPQQARDELLAEKQPSSVRHA